MGGYYDIYSVPATGGAAVSLVNVAMPASASSPSYRHPSTTADEMDFAAAERKPLIFFDEEDRWRPLDVHSFLGETHYVCQPSAACQLVSTPADLRRFPSGAWIDIEGDGGEANYRSPAAECDVDELQDCNSGPRSTIYYHVSDPSPLGYRYLDYWWFYRYNNVTDFFGDHEGDWEGMSIAPSPTNSYTFDFASFSQHGPFYSYLRDNLSCDGGSEGSCGTEADKTGRRVHVYPANGSHANYPDICKAPEVCSQTIGFYAPEYDHGGERAWGNNNDSLSLAEFPAAGPIDNWTAGPQEWVDWPGRWGASGTNGDGSPRSPGNQDHFRTPWMSECADGSDCPFQGKRAMRGAEANAARTTSVKSCRGWFGASVAALACDPGQLRTAVDRRKLGRHGQFEIRLEGCRAASAPGLAQLLGPALVPGERLIVEGRGGASTELLLRVRVGKKVYTVTFPSVKLGRKSGRAAVRVSAPRSGSKKSAHPALRLVQPDGTRTRPARVTGI